MSLSCHTNFSLRFGTLTVVQLLEEARIRGLKKIALTDINSTSGILEFFRLAPQYGIEPVAGIDFRNKAQQQFIGLAMNADGFFELNRFLSDCLQTGEAIIPSEPPEFFNAFIIYPLSKIPLRPLRENEFIAVAPHQISLVRFTVFNKIEKKN